MAIELLEDGDSPSSRTTGAVSTEVERDSVCSGEGFDSFVEVLTETDVEPIGFNGAEMSGGVDEVSGSLFDSVLSKSVSVGLVLDCVGGTVVEGSTVEEDRSCPTEVDSISVGVFSGWKVSG